MTYWSCFAIRKHLRHLKNMKLLLRHGIYTCIYCVKIFSRWNIPKRRSEAKIGQNQCSGAFNVHRNHNAYWGGGGGGELYTYRCTVTTRMTPALRWAATRAILMFHICEGQSYKTQTTTFEEKGEPKQIRTEIPPLTSLTPYRYAKPANK